MQGMQKYLNSFICKLFATMYGNNFILYGKRLYLPYFIQFLHIHTHMVASDVAITHLYIATQLHAIAMYACMHVYYIYTFLFSLITFVTDNSKCHD